MVKIIYLDMVGDLFHVGHLNIIKEAAKKGRVVVGVVTDEGAVAYKRKPIINQKQRLEIIKNIKGVWKAMLQDNLTTSVLDNMNKVGADFFMHGDDWYEGHQQNRRRFLLSEDIKILEVPYTKSISTSEIIKRIKKL